MRRPGNKSGVYFNRVYRRTPPGRPIVTPFGTNRSSPHPIEPSSASKRRDTRDSNASRWRA
jgi:hypothetical protein